DGTEVRHGVASSLPAEIIDSVPRLEKGADDAVLSQHCKFIGPLIVKQPVAVGSSLDQDVSPRLRSDQFLCPLQIFFLGYGAEFLLSDHVFDVVVVQMFFTGELGLFIGDRNRTGGEEQEQGKKGRKPSKMSDIHGAILSRRCFSPDDPCALRDCGGEGRMPANSVFPDPSAEEENERPHDKAVNI